jgi:hypothetical protein
MLRSIVDARRFGGTCRLRVHSSLLLNVSIPEDIELETIESQREFCSSEVPFLRSYPIKSYSQFVLEEFAVNQAMLDP